MASCWSLFYYSLQYHNIFQCLCVQGLPCISLRKHCFKNRFSDVARYHAEAIIGSSVQALEVETMYQVLDVQFRRCSTVFQLQITFRLLAEDCHFQTPTLHLWGFCLLEDGFRLWSGGLWCAFLHAFGSWLTLVWLWWVQCWEWVLQGRVWYSWQKLL
jgi:hypothetical protein